jgi:hypothetical protein
VQMQDKAGQNDRQINAARVTDGRTRKRLALSCDVHRSATVATRSFDLIKSDVSGMIALAIAERGTGRFEALISLVLQYCLDKDRLRIIRAPLDPIADAEIVAHREAVLGAVFFTPDARAHGGTSLKKGIISVVEQRHHYERLFNGNIADTQHIYHHTSPGTSVAQVRKLFKQLLRKSLFPRLLQYFPRHRWTGSLPVMQTCMLLGCTHGLLQKVLPMWVKTITGAVPKWRSLDNVAPPGLVDDCDDDDGYKSDDAHAIVLAGDVKEVTIGPNMTLDKDDTYAAAARSVPRQPNRDCDARLWVPPSREIDTPQHPRPVGLADLQRSQW